MRLQYQLSNGSWVDCGDRTDEFLQRCIENRQKINRVWVSLTRAEVIAALDAGRELRNDPNDWYSVCRDGEAVERIRAARRAAAPTIEMVKCSCGHTVPRGLVMSASMGTSCSECYDEMSM